MKKIAVRFNLDDARKKQLQIVAYLVGSQFLGWLLGKLVDKPDLSFIFGTAINYIAYQIQLELNKEGLTQIVKAIEKKK